MTKVCLSLREFAKRKRVNLWQSIAFLWIATPISSARNDELEK